MRTLETRKEYEEWVETLAKHHLTRDGSPPNYIANSVITDISVVSETDCTLTTNGGPWSKYTTTPTDVLRWTLGSATEDEVQKSYRRVALELLARDIRQAIDRLEE